MKTLLVGLVFFSCLFFGQLRADVSWENFSSDQVVTVVVRVDYATSTVFTGWFDGSGAAGGVQTSTSSNEVYYLYPGDSLYISDSQYQDSFDAGGDEPGASYTIYTILHYSVASNSTSTIDPSEINNSGGGDTPPNVSNFPPVGALISYDSHVTEGGVLTIHGWAEDPDGLISSIAVGIGNTEPGSIWNQGVWPSLEQIWDGHYFTLQIDLADLIHVWGLPPNYSSTVHTTLPPGEWGFTVYVRDNAPLGTLEATRSTYFHGNFVVDSP